MSLGVHRRGKESNAPSILNYLVVSTGPAGEPRCQGSIIKWSVTFFLFSDITLKTFELKQKSPTQLFLFFAAYLLIIIDKIRNRIKRPLTYIITIC